MWFKNLTLYRLASFGFSAETLSAALAKHAFTPCTSLESERHGFVPPRDGGSMVHAVGGNFLIALKTEKKLLPASVVRDATKARAAEIEEQQGFKPGRKQMRELKEQLMEELLPKAFSINSLTHVWIAPAAGWLIIDAGNETKRSAVMGPLFRAVDPLRITNLYVNHSPVAAMTEWLATDTAPAGFTVDQDVELQSQAESKATVRYARHPLDVADMGRHIAAGKRCTRLAMTWNDRVSLVLTDNLVIKGIKPLDVIKEATVDNAQKDGDERFDADFILMAGELTGMLGDLVAAMGGERPAEECGDLIERAEATAAAEASGEPDPLYDQAATVVLTHKRASISLVQRHLRIGYNRAARLLEQMEVRGVVSPASNDGNRAVIGAAA